MRGTKARKLVTLADHRRRHEQAALPVEPEKYDPSEAETTEVPILTDRRTDVLEAALDVFRVPKSRSRTLGVEPLRTDFEERYRA